MMSKSFKNDLNCVNIFVDIVELETGIIAADMVLLSGSCAVDQSSFSGQSMHDNLKYHY